MRVLIACEYSARVRDAFRKFGHDAWSADFEPCEGDPQYHHQGDVLEIIDQRWDLMIAHPPCTRMTLAGAFWLYHPEDTDLPHEARRRHPRYPERMDQLLADAEFFNKLKNANIPKICLENSQPHGLAMELVGRYTQKVQPWMFGEPYTKGACLWLKNLPPLKPTKIMHERKPACHHASPGPNRWKERSRTLLGVANAFASQWGS